MPDQLSERNAALIRAIDPDFLRTLQLHNDAAVSEALVQRLMDAADGPKTAAEVRAQARVAELEAVLRQARDLCDRALPEFDWGRSALSGEAIQLLNAVPGRIREVLGNG